MEKISNKSLENLIEELTKTDCISGFEGSFPEYLRTKISIYVDDVKIDNLGNVIGVKRSKNPNAKRVMLEAHFDQVGLIVSGFEDGGFVSFESVGSVDARILPASEVYIGNKRIYGVIGHKPPHLFDGENTTPKIENMLIDTGLSDDELKKPVKTGDKIAFKSNFTRLLNGQVSTTALDNRAGVAVLIDVAERLADIVLDFDLYFAFTTQEELGLAGAYAAAPEIKPNEAIIVDVTHGETPDSKGKIEVFPLDNGAIIFRGPNVDYEKTLHLIEVAKTAEIPYSIEVSGASSGTNAIAVQTTGEGVKTMLISIPLKYMHTTVETLAIADVEAVANLIYEYLANGGDENA